MSTSLKSRPAVTSRPHSHPSASRPQDGYAAMGAVAGNTARALSLPAVQQPERVRRRTPLSVVPARPTRGRVPFAVFSMLALVAALVVVLMLNISVSSSQYRLVSLRGEEVALAQENQALTQQLENLRAPQNLAVAAGELDMVASPTFGSIDIDSLTVTGSPEPAKESDAPPVLIPAPAVSTTNDAGTAPAPAEPAGAAGESELPAEAPPSSSEETPAGEAEAAAPTEPEPTGGGTIPAPQQAAPGQ
ncbi:hypothetical protein BJ994_001155 [Arthrobacter pigmenti]|uniref:Cell division protein FtsL n=1 Tax=Arthrobacter pigmenti TaxID=271432 RepID=A0A846RLT7_9MICC|nr:hypothetical protein [Arthrobacter pigmenti]NJC22079.1 hypothetical protein [Arthrobacter pigmenti]